MKKIYLSVMLLVAAVSYVSAQEVVAKTPGMCEFVPVSHWSLGIKGGANYFRVAPGATSRADAFHLMVGGTLEYTINPLVGLGLEYNYNPYGHDLSAGKLDGRTHDAITYASINFSNLLMPYRTGFWSKLNIYGDAGVGVGFYQFKLTDLNNDVIVDSRDSGDGVPETLMAKVGVNLEYNISKSFALGFEGQYRFYDRANLGGQDWAQGNCEAGTATIGLRYKFGANGDKQHARNISICEYYPKPAPLTDAERENLSKISGALDRLDAVEKENAEIQQKLQKLEEDMKALETMDKGVVNASFQNVEFEFASDKLTESSYSTLDQISVILINNPSWAKLEVSGHTDNIGTLEFNQTLSEARANSVKKYMLSKNVPASSVIISGYGEDKPVATNDTEEGRQKNRRVEFEITK